MMSGFAPKRAANNGISGMMMDKPHQVHQHDGDDGQDAFEIEFIGGGYGFRIGHDFLELKSLPRITRIHTDFQMLPRKSVAKKF